MIVLVTYRESIALLKAGFKFKWIISLLSILYLSGGKFKEEPPCTPKTK